MAHPVGDRAVAKIIWRLVVPMVFFVFLSALDRVNVSFAAIRMNPDLGMSASAYATGVSLFFIGYLAFQAPSLWLLDRYGARKWIGCTVIFWGIAATAMAFVETKEHFYALRVMLGFGEAGFAAGTTYCCTRWVPRAYLTGAISKTTLAIPISVIVGGPLSTTLMSIPNPPFGMEGWRFMFLAEGLPTIICGVLAFFWFINRPAEAKWLSDEEKAWLENAIATDRAAVDNSAHSVKPAQLLRSLKVWAAAFAWFSTLVGAYGVIYWLPLVVKELSNVSDLGVGFLAAIPWVGVGAGMLMGGASSDKNGERHFHIALPAILSGIAMAGAAFAGADWTGLALLTLAGFFFGAAQGAFWGLPTSFLSGAALTLGVPLINTLGSTGGLVGPKVFAWLREHYGSFTPPVLAMAGLLVLGGLAVIAIRPKRAAS